MAPTKWLEGLQKIIFRGLGGAVGVILRYFIWNHFETTNPTNTYWTSVIVNIVGAFLAGLSASYFFWTLRKLGKGWNSFRFGVIGGFTTFNWFIYDVYALIETNLINQARLIGLTFISCMIIYKLGLLIGERVTKWSKSREKSRKESRDDPREIPWRGELD